jgi:hypothetical protein
MNPWLHAYVRTDSHDLSAKILLPLAPWGHERACASRCRFGDERAWVYTSGVGCGRLPLEDTAESFFNPAPTACVLHRPAYYTGLRITPACAPARTARAPRREGAAPTPMARAGLMPGRPIFVCPGKRLPRHRGDRGVMLPAIQRVVHPLRPGSSLAAGMIPADLETQEISERQLPDHARLIRTFAGAMLRSTCSIPRFA